jgi:hypothetical protein
MDFLLQHLLCEWPLFVRGCIYIIIHIHAYAQKQCHCAESRHYVASHAISPLATPQKN